VDRQAQINLIAFNALEQMDQTIRASILEGFTGVPKGTYSRKGTVALPAALADLKAKGIPVSPVWTERNTGFYRFLVAQAGKLLGDNGLDLLQEVLSGESLQSKKGELYDVGTKLTSLDEDSWKRAKNMIINHVQQRALNWIRDQKRRNETSMSVEDEDGQDETLEVGSDPDALWKFIDVLASNKGGALFRNFREALSQKVSPHVMPVFDLVVDDPQIKTVEIARALGYKIQMGSSSLASQRQKEMWAGIKEVLMTQPKLLSQFELAQEGENLGYGSGWRTASMNRKAKNLAFLLATLLPVR
jgi:hypothetical protein